jgi:hypothetical protein
MIGMSTCPQFYSFLELFLRLELVTLHFNLSTNYTRYYMLPSKLGQTYDPKLVRVITNRLLELRKLQENQLVA